jgi:hypothetical protein
METENKPMKKQAIFAAYFKTHTKHKNRALEGKIRIFRVKTSAVYVVIAVI